MTHDQPPHQFSTDKEKITEVTKDGDCWYVRFSRNRFRENVVIDCPELFLVVVDLDAEGDPIGIEAIGCENLDVPRLLKQAGVHAPKLDTQHYPIREL